MSSLGILFNQALALWPSLCRWGAGAGPFPGLHRQPLPREPQSQRYLCRPPWSPRGWAPPPPTLNPGSPARPLIRNIRTVIASSGRSPIPPHLEGSDKATSGCAGSQGNSGSKIDQRTLAAFLFDDSYRFLWPQAILPPIGASDDLVNRVSSDPPEGPLTMECYY